jgi:hypothetical protein
VRSLSLSGGQLSFLLCFAGTNRPSTMLGRQRRRITPTPSLSTRAAGLRVANFARTSSASLPTSKRFYDDFVCFQKDGGHGALHVGIAADQQRKSGR